MFARRSVKLLSSVNAPRLANAPVVRTYYSDFIMPLMPGENFVERDKYIRSIAQGASDIEGLDPFPYLRRQQLKKKQIRKINCSMKARSEASLKVIAVSDWIRLSMQSSNNQRKISKSVFKDSKM